MPAGQGHGTWDRGHGTGDTGAHCPDRPCHTVGHGCYTHPPPPHSISLTKFRGKPSNTAHKEDRATPQEPAPSLSTCSGFPQNLLISPAPTWLREHWDPPHSQPSRHHQAHGSLQTSVPTGGTALARRGRPQPAAPSQTPQSRFREPWALPPFATPSAGSCCWRGHITITPWLPSPDPQPSPAQCTLQAPEPSSPAQGREKPHCAQGHPWNPTSVAPAQEAARAWATHSHLSWDPARPWGFRNPI